MTRSNLHITLSNGKKILCVADSSSAPEQGYFVEQVILPLLSYGNADRELSLLSQHCTMDEQRINADYRYEIDLQNEQVSFYEEHYIESRNTFKKGLDLTGRYISYLKKITTETEKYGKRKFRGDSIQDLVNRINGLPDGYWEEELTELHRRSRLSNGAFLFEQKGAHITIIRNETPEINHKP